MAKTREATTSVLQGQSGRWTDPALQWCWTPDGWGYQPRGLDRKEKQGLQPKYYYFTWVFTAYTNHVICHFMVLSALDYKLRNVGFYPTSVTAILRSAVQATRLGLSCFIYLKKKKSKNYNLQLLLRKWEAYEFQNQKDLSSIPTHPFTETATCTND